MTARKIQKERGASAVEFAIVVPLFLMLTMGMITGGLSFNRKMSLTHAAREAARFGATVPTGKVAIPDSWFDDIAQRAITSSDGQLVAGVEGYYSCVAYVGPASPPGATTDWTKRREQIGTGGPTYSNAACFSDGRAATERRVQVVVRRQSRLDAFVFSVPVTLASESVVRFEAVTP